VGRCKAIDGIYVSQELLTHAKGIILSLGMVTHSDHCAVWIDIQANLIEMVEQDLVVRPACT